MSKIAPQTQVNANTQLVLNESTTTDAPVRALFQQGRTFSTFMFWIAFFMCLLMVYALGSWLPKLMLQAGYSLGASMLFLFALNIGGMVGAIGGGALADRFHLKPVITIMFIVGSAALILLGINSPQFILYSLIAIAGAATIGSQILLYTFVAQFYPTALRSTGMGWASGIGRIGAIIGPVLTGALLSFELPHQMNFLAIAIPGVIAALAIFMVNLKPLLLHKRHQLLTLKTRLPSSKHKCAEDWRIFLKWIMELLHRFKPCNLAITTLFGLLTSSSLWAADTTQQSEDEWKFTLKMPISIVILIMTPLKIPVVGLRQPHYFINRKCMTPLCKLQTSQLRLVPMLLFNTPCA